MTEQEKQKEKRHKADAIARKNEFLLKNGLDDFHRGHIFHPQLSFGAGFSLITFGFMANKVFFVVWIYGMLHTLKRFLVINPDDENRFLSFISNHPKYFFAGGSIAYILFRTQGYKVGELKGLTILALKMLGL